MLESQHKELCERANEHRVRPLKSYSIIIPQNFGSVKKCADVLGDYLNGFSKSCGKGKNMAERLTAKYKTVSDNGGNRYLFFCDVSGAHVLTTKKSYCLETPEKELLEAWQAEGRRLFNRCHKCGKWVIDEVYNAEVLECVECAPYECEPNFCKNCGKKLEQPAENCPSCGKPLIYKGGID